MIKKYGSIYLIFAIFFVSGYSAFFMVDQTEQAVVIQMGKIMGEPLAPGLHIKIPFIQKVVRIDNRLLDYTPSPF